MVKKLLINLAGRHYPLVITYRRNSVNVNVKVRDGIIKVSAPYHYPVRKIEKLVRDNETKIIAAVDSQGETKKRFESGKVITVVGRNYVIEPQNHIKRPRVMAGRLIVDQNDVENQVYNFARKQLGAYIVAKLNENRIGIRKLTIRKYKSKWGSCNVKYHDLAFNVELAFLSLNVIDYVFYHEISHIKHPNHSKEFWNEVASRMPDYKIHKEKLKEVRI